MTSESTVSEPAIDDGFRPLRVQAIEHDTDDSVVVTFFCWLAASLAVASVSA